MLQCYGTYAFDARFWLPRYSATPIKTVNLGVSRLQHQGLTDTVHTVYDRMRYHRRSCSLGSLSHMTPILAQGVWVMKNQSDSFRQGHLRSKMVRPAGTIVAAHGTSPLLNSHGPQDGCKVETRSPGPCRSWVRGGHRLPCAQMWRFKLSIRSDHPTLAHVKFLVPSIGDKQLIRMCYEQAAIPVEDVAVGCCLSVALLHSCRLRFDEQKATPTLWVQLRSG